MCTCCLEAPKALEMLMFIALGPWFRFGCKPMARKFCVCVCVCVSRPLSLILLGRGSCHLQLLCSNSWPLIVLCLTRVVLEATPLPLQSSMYASSSMPPFIARSSILQFIFTISTHIARHRFRTEMSFLMTFLTAPDLLLDFNRAGILPVYVTSQHIICVV